MLELLEQGFSWGDVYTQCVIGNILLSFRRGVEPDPYFCADEGAREEAEENALLEESIQLLQNYMQDYYQGQEPYAEPTKKDADEFIKIHKYLQERKDDDEKRTEDPYDYPAYDDVLDEMPYDPSFEAEV